MTSNVKVKDTAYYEALLRSKPHEFLADLDRNLIDGGSEGDAAGTQLDILLAHQGDKDSIVDMVQQYRNEDGDTLAHTAATFHRQPRLMTKCFDLSPKLLLEQRTDDFAGQTPMHIVIAKGNRKMAKAILEHPHSQENRRAILTTRATGSKFKNTVMMGQLPLSVAALTFDRKMVKLLLKHGADIGWYNEDKDTVLHSLIKFADVHSDKINDVLEMMQLLNTKLSRHNKDIWHGATNKDKLTPLKLAASKGLVEIFTTILNLDGVYRSLNAHDGLFDIHLYDITEIDTITQAEFERYDLAMQRFNKDKEDTFTTCFKRRNRGKKSWNDTEHQPALKHKTPAVLDIICQLPVQQAFDFISVEAVQELIKLKWNHYKWFFHLWAIYHLLLIIHVTAFAIYKTKVINANIYPSQKVSNAEKNFVYVTAGVVLIYATIYLMYELVRSIYFKQRWYLRKIQHNGIYRLMLFAFSFFLVIDAIWFYIQPHNNYFLILALILGWTYMTFFLRTWKRFSFYTVMFQKVLLGDMTRLFVIILFQLVAFSIAIYTVFLNTRPVPSGFENVGLATMTMFKLMLGLTDIEVLHDAREPWLAISLYVLFVLVTYVLLINSLIAMMSRTCDLISEDRNRQWELQRLSVILLVETMLLPRWRYLYKAGIKAIRRYGLRIQEFRCYIEITSVQTTYRDGKAILKRKAMIDTMGFSNHDRTTLWSPAFFGTTGPHGINEALKTVFREASMQRIMEEEESTEEETDGKESGLEDNNNNIATEDSSDESYNSDIGGNSNNWESNDVMIESIHSYQRGKQRTVHRVDRQQSINQTNRHKYHRALLTNAWLRHRLNQLKKRGKYPKRANQQQTTERLHATGNTHQINGFSQKSSVKDSVDLVQGQAKQISQDKPVMPENPKAVIQPSITVEPIAEQKKNQEQLQRNTSLQNIGSALACVEGYTGREGLGEKMFRYDFKPEQQIMINNPGPDVQSDIEQTMSPVKINDKPRFVHVQTKDPRAEQQPNQYPTQIQKRKSVTGVLSVSVEPTNKEDTITDIQKSDRKPMEVNTLIEDKRINLPSVLCDPESLQIQPVDITVFDSHI